MTVAKEPLGTLDSTTTVGERPGTADGLEAPLPEKTAAGAGGALDVSVRRIRREQLRQLLHMKAFLVGSVIVLWWVVCAIFGPSFAPYDATSPNILTTNLAPSAAHWFGTDSVGQDVLSRVIVGARDILEIAPLATLLGTVLGTAMGLAQGYLGGIFDMLAGRVVDAALSLPTVIVAFLFVVAVGPFHDHAHPRHRVHLRPHHREDGARRRSARARARLHRRRPFEERSGPCTLCSCEILPNVLGPIIVEFTVRLGYAIFTIATLSFLGFGVQLPTPDWGADIANNYNLLAAGDWWEVLFPALAIASLVIAINLIGDSLESVLIQ